MKQKQTAKQTAPAKVAPTEPVKALGSRFRGMFAILPGLWQRKSLWPWLSLELLLAVSLSVAYYFLVKTYSTGVEHNSTNFWTFTSCSAPVFHLGELGDEWKGRLSGLLASGWLFDCLVKDSSVQIGQYSSVFGLYQSAWLFLLFLVIICSLRYSLFINLGIFAGLIYNFTPTSGFYFYPWDIPATFFLTLAVVFFEYRRLSLMMATICIGCFFKETVLVGALLVLFATRWKWGARLLGFVAMFAVYALGKKLLLAHLNLHVAAFSMSNATNWGGLLQPTKLIANFKAIFSPNLNHPIFANAGTLAAVLLFGWRRRFLPYMTVILVSFFGLLVYGGFSETRDFMQLLPLSLIILSERWQGYLGSGNTVSLPLKSTPALATRGTFPLLIPAVVALMVLSTGALAWRYQTLCEALKPDHQARIIATLKTKAGNGDAQAQFLLAKRFLRGEGTPVNPTESFHWFLKAAEQGHSEAEYQLGLLYVQGVGTPRDYETGISWFRKAAAQDNIDAEYNLGYSFENGLGVKVDLAEAAIWYQRAGERGHVVSQNQLGMICFTFRKDYAEAEKWFRRAAEQGSSPAENSLGVLYLQGLGVKQDNNAAFNWFQKSAESGCAEGQNDYALLLSRMQNFTDAADWFRKAADQGHANAQFNLGQLVQKGLGRPQDLAEAALWYSRSAQLGNAQAQLSLGKLYRQGQGVHADNVEAYKWLRLAQLQGVPEAQNEVAACAAVMSKDELAAAENKVEQFQSQGN